MIILKFERSDKLGMTQSFPKWGHFLHPLVLTRMISYVQLMTGLCNLHLEIPEFIFLFLVKNFDDQEITGDGQPMLKLKNLKTLTISTESYYNERELGYWLSRKYFTHYNFIFPTRYGQANMEKIFPKLKYVNFVICPKYLRQYYSMDWSEPTWEGMLRSELAMLISIFDEAEYEKLKINFSFMLSHQSLQDLQTDYYRSFTPPHLDEVFDNDAVSSNTMKGYMTKCLVDLKKRLQNHHLHIFHIEVSRLYWTVMCVAKSVGEYVASLEPRIIHLDTLEMIENIKYDDEFILKMSELIEVNMKKCQKTLGICFPNGNLTLQNLDENLVTKEWEEQSVIFGRLFYFLNLIPSLRCIFIDDDCTDERLKQLRGLVSETIVITKDFDLFLSMCEN